MAWLLLGLAAFVLQPPPEPTLPLSSVVRLPSPLLRKGLGLVRTYGLAGALRHARTVGLHHVHAALDHRRRAVGAGSDPTAAKAELHDLTVAGEHRAAGVHYLPTPWRVLDWVHEALPPVDPGWTFLDLGCGKGRALLAAAQRPYGRVVGVEFAAELAAVARAAVAACPETVAGSVEVIRDDAARVELPTTPLVVFLFNPFGPPVIDHVADRLQASYDEQPRPIVVAYLNPAHAQAFTRQGAFQRVPLARRLAWRFRLLSPYRLDVLASPEAVPLLTGPRYDLTPARVRPSP
jgi:SAM-dependent methyltransferase